MKLYHGVTLLVVLLIMAGCAPAAVPTDAATQGAMPPAPTLAPTVDITPFRDQLIAAWRPETRDLAFLQSVMVDPFIIGGPDAPLFDPLPPVDALARLQEGGYFASQTAEGATFTSDPEEILRTILYDPLVAFPYATEFIYMGLADNGSHIVLVIGQDAASQYNFSSVLAVPAGALNSSVFNNPELYNTAFMAALNSGDAAQISQFVPAAGVQVRSTAEGNSQLATPVEVIAWLKGGADQPDGAFNAYSNYDDVVALMGNPYEPFPDAQSFIIIERPNNAPKVIAIISREPNSGQLYWSDIFLP